MLRLRVPEMTEQNSNCSGVAIAVDGYKFRYRYQIQIRMQIHMHVERRTEIQIQLQVHLYQTLFESQRIGAKYTCGHIYINTFRFLDSQSLTRFTRVLTKVLTQSLENLDSRRFSACDSFFPRLAALPQIGFRSY